MWPRQPRGNATSRVLRQATNLGVVVREEAKRPGVGEAGSGGVGWKPSNGQMARNCSTRRGSHAAWRCQPLAQPALSTSSSSRGPAPRDPPFPCALPSYRRRRATMEKRVAWGWFGAGGWCGGGAAALVGVGAVPTGRGAGAPRPAAATRSAERRASQSSAGGRALASQPLGVAAPLTSRPRRASAPRPGPPRRYGVAAPAGSLDSSPARPGGGSLGLCDAD